MQTSVNDETREVVFLYTLVSGAITLAYKGRLLTRIAPIGRRICAEILRPARGLDGGSLRVRRPLIGRLPKHR